MANLAERQNKPARNVILLIGVICSFMPATYGTVLYKGCYQTTWPRVLNLTPLYHPDRMSPEICVDACLDLGMTYAAVTAGRFCFCGNTLPPISQSASEALCNDPCSDSETTLTCGSRKHIAVYQIPVYIQNVKITREPSTNGIVPVFQSTTFNVSADGGMGNITWQVDFGDGSMSEFYQVDTSTDEHPSFTKSYGMPGEYLVTAEASDSAGIVQSGKASTLVLVQAAVEDVTLTCPEVVATGKPFTCDANVLSGTYMQTDINYGDSVSENFTIADAKWHSAGEAFSGDAVYNDTDDSLAQLYVMPGAEFQDTGTLVAFQYYAVTTGAVNFVLLRPSCSSNSYCHDTNDCQSSCESSYHVQCTGGNNVLCPASGRCTDIGITTCSAISDRYATAPNMDYEVIEVFAHIITYTGLQNFLVDLTSPVTVNPGDVVGYATSNTGGRIGTRLARVNEVEDKQDLTGAATAVPGDTIPLTTSSSGDNTRHLLRAMASRPTMAKFYHTYNNYGLKDLDITIDTRYVISTATDAVVMAVEDEIDLLVFLDPGLLSTYIPITFEVQEELRYCNVTYMWDFGDGTVLNTTVPSTTHVYYSAGEYNLTVYAENRVSNLTNTTLLLIDDCVDGLALLAPQIIQLTEVADIWVNMTKGIRYSCSWDMGDGNMYTTNETTTPASGSYHSHDYMTVGTYTINVTCSTPGCSTSEEAVIEVQGVDGVALVAPENIQLTELASIWVNMTRGISYTCSWDMGDGISYTTNGTSTPASGSYHNHEYMSAGIYTINVTCSAPGCSTSAETVIEVQGVHGVALVAPDNIQLTQVANIWINITRGLSYTCSWDMGDGNSYTTDEVTTPASGSYHNHEYTSAGTYTINVTCFAPGCSTSEEALIEVQGVDGLALVAPQIIPLTQIADIWVNMTQGIRYSCFWDMGDGNIYTTNETATPTSGSFHSHEYTTAGIFAINVTCSAPGCSTSDEAVIVVQEAIAGISVAELGKESDTDYTVAWTYTHGTDTEWEVLLDDSTLSSTTYNDITKTGNTSQTDGLSTGVYIFIIHGWNDISDVSLSVNITFEAPFTGPDSSVDQSEVMVRDEVTFTVEILTGTSITVTWDFGDGSPVDVYALEPLEDWPPGGQESTSHTYTTAGQYDITVTIGNNAAQSIFIHNVTVYSKMDNLTLETNSPVIFDKTSGLALFRFVDSEGGVPPTLKSLEVDFGDGNTESLDDPIFNHTYLVPGTYQVTLTATNPLDASVVVKIIHIAVPVRDLFVDVFPPHASVDEQVRVEISMDQGFDVILTVDYGDGGTPITKSRTGTGPYDVDAYEHTYKSVGLYTITVTATNEMGSTDVFYRIVVQQPVKNEFVITTTAPLLYPTADITMTLDLPLTSTIPSNATIIWDKGDGSDPVVISVDPTPPFHLQLDYSYNSAGHFTSTFTIFNLASSLTLSVPCGVYEEITDLKVIPMYKPDIPTDSPYLPGIGANSDTFSIDYPLQLFLTAATGTLQTSFLDFTHESGFIFSQNSTTNPSVTQLPQSGRYDVVFTAWNPVSSEEDTFSINVVQRTFGVSINDFGYINVAEEAKPWELSWDKLGSDACFSAVFTDLSKSVNHKHHVVGTEVYGEADACAVLYPDQEVIGPITNPMTITHTSKKDGNYRINVTTKDLHWPELVTASSDFLISSKNCKHPIIDIKDRAQSFTDPLKVFRKDRVRFVGITQLDCALTFNNDKNWLIMQISPSDGSTIAVIDMMGLKDTSKNSELVVIEHYLEYGLYKVSFVVDMDEMTTGDQFTNQVDTFVEVVNSPLHAAIVAGGMSGITRGDSQTVTLNPAKYSFDPDLPEGIEQVFSYKWFAKQIDEDYPTDFSGELSTNNPTLPYTDAELDAWMGPDLGGPFRQGPGMLALTEGKLTFTTRNMKINETYEFTVQVSKDDRMSEVTLKMTIIPGNPPQFSIQGLLNSHVESHSVTVSPTNLLTFYAVCEQEEGCAEDLEYSWKMSRKGLSDAYIELMDFTEYVNGTQGITSESIAIQPKLFQDGFELYSGLYDYRITLRAWSSDGAVGIAYTNIKVNAPPAGGNCSVSPDSGDVLTTFNIVCEDWYDADGIKKYQFYSLDSESIVERHLQQGEEESIRSELHLGPESDDHNVHIYVRIYDNNNIPVTVHIATVQVGPANKDALSASAAQLQSKSSELRLAIAEQNPQEVMKLVTRTTSIVNELRQNTITDLSCVSSVRESLASGYIKNTKIGSISDPKCALLSDEEKVELQVQREKERNTRAQLREDMVLALVNMTVDTASAILQTTTVLKQITEAPEEMTRVSQIAIVSKALDMTKTMEKLYDKGDVTREELMAVSAASFEMASSLLQSANLCIDYGLDSDEEDATKTSWFIYDTHYESTRKRISGENRQEASNNLKHETNGIVQTIANEEIVPGLHEFIESMQRSLANSVVPGEPPVSIVTEHCAVSIHKDEAANVVSKVSEDGRSSINFPAWCDMAPQPCSDKDVITLSIADFPHNTRKYVSNGEYVSDYSNTVSVEFFDKQGNPISIQNTSSPIVITMERSDKVPEFEPEDTSDAVIPSGATQDLFYISTNITREGADLHVTLQPKSPAIQYHVYIKKGSFPNLTATDWDYFFVLPPKMADINNVDSEDDPYEAFISNDVFNFIGKVVIGFREADENEIDVYDRENPPPAAVQQTTDQPALKKHLNDFTRHTFSTGCYHLDPIVNKWSSEGCKVKKSSRLITLCECNHLTTFGSGMIVTPNPIDWDFVFSNMDFFSNPTLYLTQILIVLAFLLAAIISRRQDIKDKQKLGVTPLPDNDPNDKYLYEVIVSTGIRKNAATDSKVQFIISGDRDETDVRVLEDSKRKILRRGANDAFLLACPRPLGDLNYVRLWHDNSGEGQYGSWYLRSMIVRDLQTKKNFNFIVNKWFAVEEDDGLVDRLIPLAGKEEILQFGHLFSQTTRRNLGDEHLWFSVVARPASSRFTRLQRVSCCLCLLYTSMLANALFYERTDENGGGGFEIGPFALTPQQIYVGVVVNLIVFPVNFLLVFLFRRTRPRRKRPSRINEALRKASNEREQSSTCDVRELLDSNNSSPDVNRGRLGGYNGDGFPPDYFPSTDMPAPTHALAPAHPPPEGTPVTMDMEPKDEKPKKKKKMSLPWWMLIVSWVLLWLVVLVCMAFVTFYGISFKDTKCKKWITSLVVSFFMSIFLTQPIKVFLLAMVFSLMCKKDDTEEDDVESDEEELHLQNNEQWMHPIPGTDDYIPPSRTRTIEYKPPDPEILEQAREFRVKEMKMYDVLREIGFYAFFLWVLIVVSYGFRDPNAYLTRHNLGTTFVTGGVPESMATQENDFRKISRQEDFWSWAKIVMAPGLQAGRWYNDEPPFGQRGFIADRVGRLMGYAILRQLRVKPGQCEPLDKLSSVIAECNIPYSQASEDMDDAGISWFPLQSNGSYNNSRSEYKYTTPDELNSYPHWGMHAMYSGGGYVVDLRGNLHNVVKKLEQLESERWIDRYTRVVFLEFTVYNAQVNLFAIVTMVTEFLNTGGMHTYYRVEPMNLLGSYANVALFQIACQLIYVIMVVIFVVKEIRNLLKQRKRYFLSFWNWVELAIIAMSVTSIVIFFYRLYYAAKLVNDFAESHGNAYIRFQYVGYWNELLLYLIGWLVFLGTIKFIRLLRFNKRMSLLAATLKYGAKPLGFFGIIFFIVFFAYAQFFYLIYFLDLPNFSNIVYTMETCLQMLVGKFNFSAMQFASPLLGPFVFFWYVVTVYYILVNMFLTILNESFAAVRHDIDKQSNEHEMVAFVIDRFKKWSGLGSLLGNDAKHQEAIKKRQAAEIAKLDGAEMEDYGPKKAMFNPYAIEEFPEKVDQFLNTLSQSYFNYDKFDDIFRQPQGGIVTGKEAMRMLKERGSMAPSGKSGMAKLEKQEKQKKKKKKHSLYEPSSSCIADVGDI